MSIERLNDRMVMTDDIILSNSKLPHKDQAAPHGILFEVCGHRNGHRVLEPIDSNLVVVGGAIRALENLTGATATWEPATLNSIYSVNATPATTPLIHLFGLGTGGSNLEWGSIIAPDIKYRDIINPIPMRYGESIGTADADKYFMKVKNSDGTYRWMLKEFTGLPTIKSCWKNATSPDEDGTEILTEVYNSRETTEIETFAEFTIDLNTSDGREYFERVGQLSTARFNTIGIYVGAKNSAGTEYGGVRLYAAITFNNRDLSVKTKAQFVYRLYSLT